MVSDGVLAFLIVAAAALGDGAHDQGSAGPAATADADSTVAAAADADSTVVAAAAADPEALSDLSDALTREQLLALLAETGWPAAQHEAAVCIVWEESEFHVDPLHIANDPFGGSHGLFQINGWWATEHVRADFPRFDLDQAHDPFYNAEYALLIWNEVGWWAWGTGGECGLW